MKTIHTQTRNDGITEVNVELLNAINSCTSRDADMFSFHRIPVEKIHKIYPHSENRIPPDENKHGYNIKSIAHIKLLWKYFTFICCPQLYCITIIQAARNMVFIFVATVLKYTNVKKNRSETKVIPTNRLV